MADCCLIKKVATVEVYENKNEVRAYGFMAGDRNTPVMEVRFKHLWGESNLSSCKLRWIIVDDVGSLLVGEVPIQSDNTALINLPNELFTGDRRMKVQLTVASCDGERILNLQQFTDLKVINSLAPNEVVEPVYQILINAIYDESQKYLKELETSYTQKYGSLDSLYKSAKASLEQYLINAENGGNAEFLQGYSPAHFQKVENTINDLIASTKYDVGDVVEVLGYYSAGDGSHHKRIAKSADDGSGEQGQGGIWWCVVSKSYGVNEGEVENKVPKKPLNMTMIPKPYKHNGDLNSDVKAFVKVADNTFDIITKNQDTYLSFRYRYNDFANGSSDAGSYKPNGELYRFVSTESIGKCSVMINNPSGGDYTLYKDYSDAYYPFGAVGKHRKYITDGGFTETEGIRVYKVESTGSISFYVSSYGSRVNKKTNILFFRSVSSHNEVDIYVNDSIIKTVNLKKETSGSQYLLVELDSFITATETILTNFETTIKIVPREAFCYVVGVNYVNLEDSALYTQGFDTMMCDVANDPTQIMPGANDYAFKYKKNNMWIGSYHGGETKTAEPSISIKDRNIPAYNSTISGMSLGFRLGQNITILQRTQLWGDADTAIARIHSETKFNLNGTIDFDFTFKSLEANGFEAGENFYYNMTCARDTYDYVNMTTGDFYEMTESPDLKLSYGFVEQAVGTAVTSRAICSRFDLPKFGDDSEYRSWIWKRDGVYNKLYIGFKNTTIYDLSIKTSKDFYNK